MEPGKWIRALREERLVKPSDVERITRSVAKAKRNADFFVSHSTLADIEAGSIPSLHKLYGLATCLKVPLNELLLLFGINLEEISQEQAPPGTFRFFFNFDLPELRPSETLTTSVAQRSERNAVSLLDCWAAFLPARIAKEDVGDYIEDIHRRAKQGERWQIWVRVVAAIIWTTINTAGCVAKNLFGKSAEEKSDRKASN